MTLFIEHCFNVYHLTALETNPELDSYGDTYLVMEVPSTITIVELNQLVNDKFPTCRKLVFTF
jgi:hypothetical protein